MPDDRNLANEEESIYAGMTPGGTRGNDAGWEICALAGVTPLGVQRMPSREAVVK
jgi:hypothetical protein